MKITDVANPERVNRKPDKTIMLLSSGNFTEQGFTIKKIELRLFIEKIDQKLGPFSLITSLVETDKGEVEMTYDEGYRGEDVLEKTANFILNNLGLSGIILRSLLVLQSK
ncbi:MAG TPA: hypothetical protein VD828_02145 [Candidatus Nitrosotenuis sp.]|nr:hypothetical protein [Candidatus Nitrosotenuis sp.]